MKCAKPGKAEDGTSDERGRRAIEGVRVAGVDVVDGATVSESVPPWNRHLHLPHRPVVVPAPVVENHRASVRHISLWSVTRMALAFWTCIGLVFAVAALVLWGMLSAMGVIDNVESLIGQLTNDTHFHLAASAIVFGGFLSLIAFVCLATLATVGAALFYNLLAYITGGLKLDMRAIQSTGDQQAGLSARNNGQADDTVVL
jgi:hypothetical protein